MVLYRHSGVYDRKRWALLRSVIFCADLVQKSSILQWMLAADSKKHDRVRWFDFMVSPDGEIWLAPRPGMHYVAVVPGTEWRKGRSTMV